MFTERCGGESGVKGQVKEREPWREVHFTFIVSFLSLSLISAPQSGLRVAERAVVQKFGVVWSTAPDCFTELLRIYYKPARQLRSSSDTTILCRLFPL